MFASWAYYNARLWLIGSLVANTGTWMMRIGQDWLVLTELTDDSGVALGIVNGLQFLPMLLITPWAGVLADRVSRRMLLLATQTTQGVLAAALGALVITGTVELWHVYGMALLLGVVSAVDAPVRQVFTSELVPPHALASGVSLNSVSFNLAQLIGPAVAGVLIAALGGTGMLFMLNAISFAATVGALLVMRTREFVPVERDPVEPGQLMQGLRYIKAHSDLLVILVILGSVSVLGFEHQVTSALMARQEFGLGPTEFGMFATATGVGAILAALVTARNTYPRIHTMLLAATGFGLASLGEMLSPNFVVFLMFCIPVGFFSLRLIICANTALQLRTNPAMRGRVMATYVMVLMGTIPIGSPIVGWVGEEFGARWAVGLGPMSAFLVVAVAGLWLMRNWNLNVRARWAPFPRLDITHRPM